MSSKLRVIKPVVVTDAMLASNIAETDYAAWNGATAYALADRVIRTSTHKVYERLISGASAANPEDDATNWLEVGPTNKWRMFDQSNTTASRRAASLVVTITPGTVVNSLALLNVNADTVRVQMIDPVEGSVYDRTVAMQAPPTGSGWYEYFFDPIERRSLITFTDMPAYGSAAITVTLTIGTGDASCGVLTLGRLRSIGSFGIEMGARVGVQDYSRKERDAFGNYKYVKRANSKKFSVQMLIENADLDAVNDFLAGLDGPVVWIGSDEYESLVIYGFAKDYGTTIQYAQYSQFTLDVEGLT